MIKINHKRYDKMDREHAEPGTVIERDGHFTVNYLPIIDGFVTHARKETPKLAPSQWVEVIRRDGTRERAPVETIAWGLYNCPADIRMDYMLRHTMGSSRGRDAYDFIDFEVTHYRTIQTPPDDWVQGMDWPFEDAPEAAVSQAAE